MGLIEIVIAGLCFNITCPGDNDHNIKSLKSIQNLKLIEELKLENLIVTTLKNQLLSDIETVNSSLVGSGVAFDLLNILAKKFHFNYTIKLPQTNVWGSEKTGVLDMLKNNEANISAAFLPIFTEYTDDIDYSPSLDTGEWVVLMKRPRESATGSGLLAPFTLPVWIMILFSLLIVGPIIYCIIYVEAKLCKDRDYTIFPLPCCIWFVYGALLKQGSTLNPTTDPSRLLFSTWWIFITILTAFYTANLTAFLTLSKFTLPISVPEDIGAKKSKWITTKGNALEDTMQLKEDLSSLTLSSILGPPQMYVEKSDRYILQEYVKKRNMMFLREKPIAEYVMYDDYKQKTRAGIPESERCTYVITKFAVVTYSRAFAYSKNFKYKPLFDSTIQQMVESGIIKFKLNEELPDSQICPLNLGNKERQLRNSDLVMTYLIVATGFGIAAAILFIEKIMNYLKNREINTMPNNSTVVKTPGKKYDFEANFKQMPKSKFITPPPAYHTLFNPPFITSKDIKKKTINGREYWVYDSLEGERKLVPLRTPSALLFQFTN